MSESETREHFIQTIISKDLAANKNDGRMHTRFPPEPNGYLHIGHAKSICLNFGLAQQFSGLCNLRFDDTNPSKEDVEYVDSIKNDVRWLGFDWEERCYFASDYFGKLYDYALQLIDKGLAYVDDLSPEDIREYRGTLTEPGRNSPHRERSPEDNRDLFERMKAGEFEEGSRCLRAKIDMASPNLNMRDPVIYRIQKHHHHRTGDTWCIYPLYDFAHGLSDSIEGITHSICTLEFENHRPLYDWFLDKLEVFHPQQIEFARLNLTRTVMSKRKLLKLVNEGHVKGWDDPRMPTLSGMRRRGYTPAAIRAFCKRISVTRVPGTIDMALLEHSVREDLNKVAQRVMVVMNPVKLILDNFPEDEVVENRATNNPEDPEAGKRPVCVTRELYIDRDDFMEEPPRKWRRMTLGKSVRLRYGYIIDCTSVDKDEAGNITAIHATYDPETRSGHATSDRKCKGTIHWVSAKQAVEVEVRLYDSLLKDLGEDKPSEDFLDDLNPTSLTVQKAMAEPFLAEAKTGDLFQFERVGYFCADPDSSEQGLVFNRTVGLRDSWGKKQKKQNNQNQRKQKQNKKQKQKQQQKQKPPQAD